MKKARIYVLFPSEGLFSSTQTYLLRHPAGRVVSNREIIGELRDRCDGVEFVGSTAVSEPGYALANVQAQKRGLDGLLYFGSLPEGTSGLGLPTVAVYPLWGQWQEPFHAYEGQVLTGVLPIIPDIDAAVFSSRLDRIADKIRLVQIASRMQGLRILCITDKLILGEYEPGARQVAAEGREEYERRYLENLAHLGAEIVVRPQQEMVSKLRQVAESEATAVADKWIAESLGMEGTNNVEVAESAKLYLTMKAMLDEYNADAITTEGYGTFMHYPGGPIPSQGLPSSQLCTEGVVATSETLVDSLVTQQLGLWMTGSAGFNGDYIVDKENDKAYIGHCECPLNPYGDERRVPYAIRNLPQWPVNEQEKGGACVQVELPANETVTVAKFGVHDRKLSLFTGETVSGDNLFPGWDDILCRTKLAINVDANKLFSRLDWQAFGWHRVAFYGDHIRRFNDLATLLGYEAIQEVD